MKLQLRLLGQDLSELPLPTLAIITKIVLWLAKRNTLLSNSVNCQHGRHCATNYDDGLWFGKVSGSKEKVIENEKNTNHIPTIQSNKDALFKVAVLKASVGVFNSGWCRNAERKRHNKPQGEHFMLVSKLNVPFGTPTGTNGTEVNEDPFGFDRQTVITEAGVEIPKWLLSKMPNGN
jgi:hypothetical protein